LEILGIFDLLQKWGQTEIDEILGQIEAFTIYTNKVSDNMEYQLEVYRNKNTELTLHC